MDPITLQKRNAFIHILNGQKELAMAELDNALRRLERWDTLYLRGKEEKEHIKDLILRITDSDLHKKEND